MVKYNCIECNYETEHKNKYTRHLTTKKHKKNKEDNKTKDYHCFICDVKRCNKQSYNNHLRSDKHYKKLKWIKEKYDNDAVIDDGDEHFLKTSVLIERLDDNKYTEERKQRYLRAIQREENRYIKYIHETFDYKYPYNEFIDYFNLDLFKGEIVIKVN